MGSGLGVGSWGGSGFTRGGRVGVTVVVMVVVGMREWMRMGVGVQSRLGNQKWAYLVSILGGWAE